MYYYSRLNAELVVTRQELAKVKAEKRLANDKSMKLLSETKRLQAKCDALQEETRNATTSAAEAKEVADKMTRKLRLANTEVER